MARLPVNLVIHVLVLLASTSALALLGRLGALELDGDIPTSFVAAATTSLVVLAPITMVQLALVSRREAPRPDVTRWPYLILVGVTVLLALGGLGPGVVFVTAIPLIAACSFWVADESLPRRRLTWLTLAAVGGTLVAMLGGSG